MVVRVCPGIETKSLKCEKCTSAKLPIDHQNTRCVKLFYQKEKLSPSASTICCPCVVLATYPNIIKNDKCTNNQFIEQTSEYICVHAYVRSISRCTGNTSSLHSLHNKPQGMSWMAGDRDNENN